jgi:hypothetical protein
LCLSVQLEWLESHSSDEDINSRQKKKGSTDPKWKIYKAESAGSVVQVVEHLPRNCKALSSIPVTAKNKQKPLILFKFIDNPPCDII